ncbi:hypothetical protein D5086_016358 [Populus alba]|uniref:Uncharacterized protein n=1 Tax=Populus alba TaxID=43335 RepID=A0ACC4BUF4_POPAL
MKGKGVSRDYSRRRIRSGKRTTRSFDNIVVIDVDSDDEFDNVIIIDVPESLQQKLRGSNVGDDNLDSDGTSSHSSPASDCIGKSVLGMLMIQIPRVIRLKIAPLTVKSWKDLLEEVREQWEKASLKRKSKFCKGLDDQASPCSSHGDVSSKC